MVSSLALSLTRVTDRGKSWNLFVSAGLAITHLPSIKAHGEILDCFLAFE